MEAPEEALRAIACIGIAHGDAAAPRESWTLVQCGSGFFLRGTGLVMTCEHVRVAARNAQRDNPGSVLVVCPYIGAAAPLDLQHAWEAEVLARTKCLPWDRPPHGGDDHVGLYPGDDQAVVQRVANDHADAAVLRACREFVSQQGPPDTEPETGAPAIPQLGAFVHTLRRGDSGQLRATQPLFALGFPVGYAFGTTPTASNGSFMGPYRDDNGAWLKYEGVAAGGSSGGPAITADGSVIGWVVRQVPTIPKVAYAASGVQHLRPIEEARVCFEAAGAAAHAEGGGGGEPEDE
jgi:hypothetical protein